MRRTSQSAPDAHIAWVQAQGMPNEAALVRQPSVAAAVHQALPNMPVPPITTPLSDSSSGSRDLTVSEGDP